MKIILVSKRHAGTRSITVGAWTRAILSMCMIGIPVGAVSLATLLFQDNGSDFLTEFAREAWVNDLSQKQAQIDDSKQQTELSIQELTQRVAELQARIVKLDALGERLGQMAMLERDEFDFSRAPALGGPHSPLALEDGFAEGLAEVAHSAVDEGARIGGAQNAESLLVDEAFYSAPDFQRKLLNLREDISQRRGQLALLDTLVEREQDRALDFDPIVPVQNAWLSSGYGKRLDPKSGLPSWSSGVDIAAENGRHVMAVEDGIVVSRGDKPGYRDVIEIEHGNGFRTRYSACKALNVKAGEIVKKGQVIALVESSPAGSHLHFEVYKHGRPVDPAMYFHRTKQ